MNRRKFLVYSAGAVGAMSLPLGSSVAFAKAKGTYTYLTPFTLSLAFAPVLYASASGDYDKLGVNVKVEVGRGAGQAIQLVAAKQVEAGRTGGANYLAARAQDNSDVLAFGTVSQISPFVVISSESHPISDAKELAGKVVGVASFGGSMEATLNLMLAKAGVDPKSVRRERVADGPASFAMVEAGRIAAFFGNASTVSRLRAAELPLVVLSVDDGVPGQVYVASEENLASNRDQHVAFLQGTRNAILAMADMDDAQLLEVIRSIAGRFDVPGIEKEDIALGDLKGNRELWLAHGKENVLRNVPEQWDEATRLLRGAGLMKETSRQLYTNAIWESTVV